MSGCVCPDDLRESNDPRLCTRCRALIQPSSWPNAFVVTAAKKPAEVAAQVVNAIRMYERANGSGWRA